MRKEINPLCATLLDRPLIVLDPDDTLIEDEICVEKDMFVSAKIKNLYFPRFERSL